jgi:hypothetical protein
MEDKLVYITRKWKTYYSENVPKSEIPKRIDYLEKSGKTDINTTAKIKALKSLKK